MIDIYKKGLSVAILLIICVNIIAQHDSSSNIDEATQRKFDYFFYEALNKKVQNKYAEALDLFQHCYALDSTNASVMMELGAFHNSLGNDTLAYDYVKKAVSYDDTNYYYNLIFAGLSKNLNHKKEVIETYIKLIDLYPSKLELYVELSNAFTDNEQYTDAVATLDSLQNFTGPSDAIALNKFRLYNMMNEKEEAFRQIESIVEKNPNSVRYLLLLGDLYLQDNQYEKALDYYNKAHLIEPENPMLILSMVNYYDKTGDKKTSALEIQKAISNAKMDVDMKLQLLGRYVGILNQNKQDIKEADSLFLSLFNQHPNNTQINLMYGEILMLQNNREGALEQFEIFRKANPDNPSGYEQILRVILPDTTALDRVIEISKEGVKNIPDAAQFYFYWGAGLAQQEKYNEAIEVLSSGLENADFQNPVIESDFYGQMGDLYHLLKKDELAFENYEKALELNPQNLPVLNNYSYYLSLERKDLDRAERMSGLTIKAEPTNATYLDTYGWILFEQGAYVMAKIYIEKAIQYGEDEISAEVWEHYGDVLSMTGETEKAVEQWKKAQEMGANSKTLKKKIKRKTYIRE